MTYAEFLAMIQKRGPGIGRIMTAQPYLSTLTGAVGLLAPKDRGPYTDAAWKKTVKEGAGRLVYRNEDMDRLLKRSATKEDTAGSSGPTPLAMFDAVLTSIKQDRDGDTLHPKGANVDPSAPLLWQHNPMEPIGKLFKVTEQTEQFVKGSLGIADIPLGNDAAYLAEFGALRISHGFKPVEFEPIAAKDGESITGFNVTKYDMMEVSLVSVPSNTDAVLTAFSRGKLTAPITKSWGRDLFRSRPVTVVGGWTGMRKSMANLLKCKAKGKTGTKAKVKADGDYEEKLAAAASTVLHSGDYGYCFYKASATAGQFDVYWTMGDADQGGQTPDGQPYTSADDIKTLLMAVPGTASVTVESEATPPKGEGWRMCYPEIKDWVEDQNPTGDGNSSGDGNGDGSANNPPPQATNRNGKGKKKGKKDGDPVVGSFEHVADLISGMAADFLTNAGVTIQDGEEVTVAATYPDYVVLCIHETGDEDGNTNRYFKVSYSTDADGNPTLTGTPEAVELQLVMSTETPAADTPAGGTGGDTTAGGSGSDTTSGGSGGNGQSRTRPVQKWVPLRQSKGRLTKKDHSDLKEALEHLDDALARGNIPSTSRTLIDRGAKLVRGVLEGAKDEPVGTPNPGANDDEDFSSANPEMHDQTSRMFAELKALLKGGAVKNAFAIALIMDQISTALMEQNRQEELSRLM